jgi:hypothetical protein
MSSTEGKAIAINWDCENQPSVIEQWFKSPKLDCNRTYYDEIYNWMTDVKNTDLLDCAYLQTLMLFQRYSETWDGPELIHQRI